MDPVDNASVSTFQARSVIYDTLMQLNPDGVPEPELAEAVDVSDDTLVYTFTLREGVKFHDGTPFDAEAVVFNLNRHLDPNLMSTSRGLLTPVTAVEALDESTVRITLSSPSAAFLAALSQAPGQMASPAAVQAGGDDYARNPVGTGPYTFVEWMSDDHLTVRRNADYWGELGFVDEIVFRPITEVETRWATFTSGELDVVITRDGGVVAEARADGELTMAETAGFTYSAIVFNTQRAPFDDVRVRRAVSHAINRDAVIDVIHSGVAEPAVSSFSPDTPWYTPIDAADFDLDEARTLVEEVEEETGTQLAFTMSCLTSLRERAEVYQQMLREAGIDVTIETREAAAMADLVIGGNHEVACWEGQDIFDPDAFVYRVFHSGEQLNLARYENPDVDKLLELGRTSSDFEERKQAYAEMWQIIADDVPWVWVDHPVLAVIASGQVGGMTSDNVPLSVPPYAAMYMEGG